MWYRDNKICRLLASILIFVLIFLECMTDLVYASPLNMTTNIIAREANLASPGDASGGSEDKDNTDDDVILDKDVGNIEVDGEDINRTEKEYTYGIQNTGTRDGVLGTRLILTCTGIASDEIEVYASINEEDYGLLDVYEEPFELLEGEEEGQEESFKYVYYLPVLELATTEKAGYKLKLVFNPSEDYKVSGLFSARMVGDINEDSSENIFSKDVKDYSNTLHSNGDYEEGENGLFSVRFRTNGGEEVETQKVLLNECAIEPDEPLRTGYTFKYWSYNKEQYDFSSPVTQNMTLYAVWEPNLCTVIFEANNGDEDITQEVQYGKKIPKPQNPKRAGYKFMGWYLEDKKWEFGTDIVDETYLTDWSMTLKARWGDISYWRVEFRDTDDSDLLYASYSIEDGLHVTRIPVPRKSGYSFTKWTLEDGSDWDPTKEVTNDLVILANWEKLDKTYTVKFDLNGGTSDTIETQVVKEGGFAIEPEPPTLDEYTFDGWYIGNTKYDFSQPVTKNLRLKARWAGSYTVTFDLDGGQGEFPPIVVASGTTVTEPDEVPTREGYKFKGWYFNDNRYVFSEPVYQDIKLVAKWMDLEAFEGRYAVSIYGIYADKDISGKILGLTFGPALVDRNVDYVSHIPEEDGAMCIHDMSWKQIIEQSKRDATVFQECLEHGCTKSVEFELKGELAWPYKSYEYTDASDGDGYIGLIDGYNKYTINNQNITRAYAGSILRTVLIGRTGYTNRKATGKWVLRRDASLAYMLPGELSDHIVPRKYTYWNDTKFKTLKSLTDKVWLFSWSEIYNPLFWNGKDDRGIRVYGDGETYEKIERYAVTGNATANKMQLLNNTHISTANTWLRTPYRYMYGAANAGVANANTVASIAPGFCLAGPSKANTKYRIWFNTNTDDPTLTGVEALEPLMVKYNQKVSTVVDSLPKLYRGNGYELVGWYEADTSKELRFGKNITKFSVENRLTLSSRITKSMNVYARWGRPGYLKSISLLKSTMNSQALHFKQSKKLTSKYAKTDISQMSDESLYTWYDPEDRTQYWWSSVNKMIVSDDASNAFSDMQNWQTIDLTHITFQTVKSMYRMFYNCQNLQKVTFDEKPETLNVTNMSEMFKNCYKLEQLDMGGVSAPMVTTFVRMFESCSKIKRINLGNFKTPNATTVNAMFNGCSSLEYLDMSQFDTHKVTDTRYMYLNCSNLKEIVYGDDFVDTGLNAWGVQDLMHGTHNYYTPGDYHDGDSNDNPTFQMYQNCPANRPHMWSEGRWIENQPTKSWGNHLYFLGTYIKNHNVSVRFANASMVNYPISTVPNFTALWGHTFKDENLPDLGVYHDDALDLDFKFIGWNEEPSGYYKTRWFGDAIHSDEHVGYANELFITGNTEFRYIKSGFVKYDNSYGDNTRAVDYSELEHWITGPYGSETGHSSGMYIYPRWSCEGLAKDGHIINGYINANATSFKQSIKEPTGVAGKNYTDISYTDDRSVRTWYDASTRTQWWWSSTGTMTLYSNAYNMFNGKSNLQSVDLRNIDFSRCTSMATMFNGCTALKEVITDEGLDTSKVTIMTSMFQSCTSLETLSMEYFDTENVTLMNQMFQNCTKLKNLDINMLDTSSVTNMASMFYLCSSLEHIELNNLDTSAVTTMESMFNSCTSLKDITLTVDTSNVTTMKNMFNNCTQLTDVHLSSLDVSSVTTMEQMFYKCSSLEDIELSFTLGKLLTMSHMFAECGKLKHIDINNLNTSTVTTMEALFYNCKSLTDVEIGNIDTTSVTNMNHMFRYCSNLENLDIHNFDTHKVTVMRYMFDGDSKLKNITFGDGFVDDNIESVSYLSTADYNGTNYMYRGCNANKPYKFEVGRWTTQEDLPPGTYLKNHKVRIYYYQSYPHNVSGITMPSMYEATWGYPIGEAAVPELSDPSGEVVFDGWNEQDRTYNLNKRVTADTVFNYTRNQGQYTYLYNGGNYTNIYLYSKWTCVGMAKKGEDIRHKINTSAKYFKQSEIAPDRTKFTVYDISLCDDESVLTWRNGDNQYWWSSTGTMKIYKDAHSMFYGLYNYLGIDLTNVDFSIVTNMSQLFEGLRYCKTITFDENIDTSKVTNMHNMFQLCDDLLTINNITSLDTQNVTNMSGMFANCWELPALDISTFDTSSVTNMSYMFESNAKLKNLVLGDMNTSKVTTMYEMFYDCNSLTELDLSSFDTSNVTNMQYMFDGCSNLRDITYSDKFVSTKLVDLNKYLNNYDHSASSNATFDMFKGCPANRPDAWTTGRWFKDMMYLENYKVVVTYAHAKNKVINGITVPATREINWGYPLTEEDLPEMVDPRAEAKFAGWNEESEGYTLNKEVTPGMLLDFTDNASGTRRHGLGDNNAYITLYMRWTSEGVAKPGSQINGKLNKNALHFKQWTEDIPAGTKTTDISLSDDNSVRTWYDAESQTQYWWSSVGEMIVTNSANNMFMGMNKLVDIDLTNVDFSLVSTLENFCYNCTSLEEITFDKDTDIPKVTNLHNMFANCTKLKGVDLTTIDSAQITTMQNMFSGCSSIESIDISSITSQKINNVYAMFDDCAKLADLKLNNTMSTPGITDVTYMFRNCSSLESIDLSWMNTAKVVYTRYMFENCTKLTNIVYSDKFVENSLSTLHRMQYDNTTYGMFHNCPANKPYLWTVGRWSDIDDKVMPGCYIKGHNVNLRYSANIAAGVTVSGVPATKTVQWGYEIGDESIPKLTCSDDRIQFLGWDEGFSTINETGEYLTANKEFRYTDGVEFGSYDSYYHPGWRDYTNLYLYAKWRADGLAKVGSSISASINNNAIRFKQSFEKPESMTGVTDISFCNDRTLLTWYDAEDQTQYWWGINGKFIANDNSANMFANKANLQEIDLTNIDFARTTTLASAFAGCTNLETLDMSVCDTSNVTTLARAYTGCKKLSTLNMNACDFSNLVNMESAFANAGIDTLDLSNVEFPALTNLSGAFANSEVETLNMSKASFKAVTNLTNTFANCTSLKSVNLSNSDFSSVASLVNTFTGCTSLIDVDFTDADFSAVTLLSSTFNNCSSLVNLDISVFDYTQITSVNNLLANCTSLETVTYGDTISKEYDNLQYFDAKNPTYRMYYNCTATKPETWETGRWDENGTYINNLFYTVTYEVTHDKFTNVGGFPDDTFEATIKWGHTLDRDYLPNLVDTSGEYVFDGWYWIDEGYGDTKRIEISDEEVIKSNITLYARWRREGWMMPGDFFSGALQEYYGELPYTTFKHGEALPEGIEVHDVSECEDGSVWMWGEDDTVYWWTSYDKAKISDASLMFSGLENFTTVDLTNLDFSRTKDMVSMFADDRVLTTVNFGDIDTSNVEDMSYMFDRCVALETIDVAQLNTSRVSDMSRMFGDCIALTEILNINSWNTSNVDSMRGMFSGCELLGSANNGRIEFTFNTSNVTDMSEMFDNCISFRSLTIRTFDTSKVRNFRSMFYGDSRLTYIYYGDKFVPDSGIYFESMYMDVDFYTYQRLLPSKDKWPGTWEDDGTYKNY